MLDRLIESSKQAWYGLTDPSDLSFLQPRMTESFILLPAVVPMQRMSVY